MEIVHGVIQHSKELEDKLIKYKEVTLMLIQAMEREEFDTLEASFNSRQLLICDMNTLKYTQEQFKDICAKEQILFFEHKLRSLLTEKRGKVRKSLEALSNNKAASKNYTKTLGLEYVFMSRRI